MKAQALICTAQQEFSAEVPVDDIAAGFDLVRRKPATKVAVRIAQEYHID